MPNHTNLQNRCEIIKTEGKSPKSLESMTFIGIESHGTNAKLMGAGRVDKNALAKMENVVTKEFN